MRKTIFGSVIAISFAACSGATDGGPVGTAVAHISSVPPNVSCIDIQVTGASRTAETLTDLMPGQTNVVLRLDNLPTGQDVFWAAAYPVPCAMKTGAQLTWVTPLGTVATITAGGVTPVSLTLEPAGGANVGINFGDGGTPPGDGGVPSDGGVPFDGGAPVDGGGAGNDLSVGPRDLAMPPPVDLSMLPPG